MIDRECAFKFKGSFPCGVVGFGGGGGCGFGSVHHQEFVTASKFDFRQELLWIGLNSGNVQSYVVPGYQPYTARQAHNACISSIHTDTNLGGGVLVLSPTGLKFMSRRALIHWDIEALQVGVQSFLDCSFTTLGSSHKLLVSTLSGEILSVSIEHGISSREISCPGVPITHLRPQGPHTVAAARANGNLNILDTRMRASNPVSKINILKGHFTDLSVLTESNIISACGLNNGIPTLSISDIRNMSKKILYNIPALLLQPLEDMPSTSVLVATNSTIEIVEIDQGQVISSIELENPPSTLSVSLTNDYLALCDLNGLVNIYSLSNFRKSIIKESLKEYKPRVNYVSDPIEVPSMIKSIPIMPWNQFSEMSFNEITGIPYYDTPLLSGTWPPRLWHSIGLPRPYIDQRIMEKARTDGPITFTVRQSSLKNNQWPYRSHVHVARFKSMRQSGTIIEENSLKDQNITNCDNNKDLKKQSKLKTSPSSSCTSKERLRAISNSSVEDSIIKNRNIAEDYRIMQIEYSKFGVLDFDFDYFNKTEYTGLETGLLSSYVNAYLQVLFYSKIIRNYAIEHSLSDCFDETCLICESGFLFRMLQESKGRACCRAANWLAVFNQRRETAALNMRENPLVPFNSQSITMQQCARYILEEFNLKKNKGENKVMDNYMMESNMNFQCPKCIENEIRESNVFTIDIVYPGSKNMNLNINFIQILENSLHSKQLLRSWCSKCTKYVKKIQWRRIFKLPNFIQLNSNVGAERNSDWWITKDQENFIEPNIIIKLKLNGEVEVKIPTTKEELESSDLYILTSIVCEVLRGKPHMISHIQTKLGQWYLFNDFKVIPVPESQVKKFPSWMIPSVLHYSKKAILESEITKIEIKPNKLFTEGRLLLPHNLERNSKQNEIISSSNQIFAIDSEFVSLQEEIADFTSEGEKKILQPTQLSLARVSVLRGTGTKSGTVFLDDYIVPCRPIVDYLTKYSGIKSSDLNPLTSSHNLVTLKTAYRKLRAMVDSKVKFVGHGLAQDFRIINIYVPSDQIIDTVDLYYIPSKQRKLSLKFLAWSVLGFKIQKFTHDSIEDARMALSLYKKYTEKIIEGDWEDYLKNIYKIGRLNSFKAPPD